MIDYTTYEGDDLTPLLENLGMRPIDDAVKDGEHCLLLVDYGSDWLDRSGGLDGRLEDSARYGLLIGNNNLANTDDDRWDFGGWSWSHDCYTGFASDDPDGAPTVVGYRPLLPETLIAARLKGTMK